MIITPRDYQRRAIDSLYAYFEQRSGNPLLMLASQMGCVISKRPSCWSIDGLSYTQRMEGVMDAIIIYYTGNIVTRKEAIASGLKRYFTSKPCGRGHMAQRLVSSRACVRCSCLKVSTSARRRRAARREYYREKGREDMRKWRAAHPEKTREARRRQRAKNIEAERARDREHYRKTKEYQKNRHKEYRTRKPHVIAALAAKRRAAIIAQTPSWANMDAVRKFYLEAEQKTASTGISHHVDHFIPLRGANVCGLHWEGNLRVITGKENMEKSNKMPVIS